MFSTKNNSIRDAAHPEYSNCHHQARRFVLHRNQNLWVHRFSWSQGATCGSANVAGLLFQVFFFLFFFFFSSTECVLYVCTVSPFYLYPFFKIRNPLFFYMYICSICSRLAIFLPQAEGSPIQSESTINLRLRSIHRIPSVMQQGPLPDSSDVLPSFPTYCPYCTPYFVQSELCESSMFYVVQPNPLMMMMIKLKGPHFCNSSALHCPDSTCSQFPESASSDPYHCPWFYVLCTTTTVPRLYTALYHSCIEVCKSCVLPM